MEAYTLAKHGVNADIQLFKDPDRLLATTHTETPDILGFANYV